MITKVCSTCRKELLLSCFEKNNKHEILNACIICNEKKKQSSDKNKCVHNREKRRCKECGGSD